MKEQLEIGTSPDQLAREFNLSLEQIFEFIDEELEYFQHDSTPKEGLTELWGQIAGWGKLRALIYGTGGAVTECMTSHAEFELSQLEGGEGRLNLIREDLHLHIPWQKVEACYLIGYKDQFYRANFVDRKGDLVFRVSLQKEGGKFLEKDTQAP